MNLFKEKKDTGRYPRIIYLDSDIALSVSSFLRMPFRKLGKRNVKMDKCFASVLKQAGVKKDARIFLSGYDLEESFLCKTFESDEEDVYKIYLQPRDMENFARITVKYGDETKTYEMPAIKKDEMPKLTLIKYDIGDDEAPVVYKSVKCVDELVAYVSCTDGDFDLSVNIERDNNDNKPLDYLYFKLERLLKEIKDYYLNSSFSELYERVFMAIETLKEFKKIDVSIVDLNRNVNPSHITLKDGVCVDMLINTPSYEYWFDVNAGVDNEATDFSYSISMDGDTDVVMNGVDDEDYMDSVEADVETAKKFIMTYKNK